MELNRGKIIAIVLTILLHILPLLFLIKHKIIITDVPPRPNRASVSVTFIPPISLNKKNITKQRSDSIYYRQIDPTICKDKDDQYIGVGLVSNIGSNLIIILPEFYPAYIAGVRLGDEILNPYATVVNGYMDLDIMRYTTPMHFHIKAENICFKPS